MEKKAEKEEKIWRARWKNNLCLLRDNIKAVWKQIDACAIMKLDWIAGGAATMRLRYIIARDRWIDDMTQSLLLSMVPQRGVIAKECMNRLKFWHVFRSMISTLFL